MSNGIFVFSFSALLLKLIIMYSFPLLTFPVSSRNLEQYVKSSVQGSFYIYIPHKFFKICTKNTWQIKKIAVLCVFLERIF